MRAQKTRQEHGAEHRTPAQVAPSPVAAHPLTVLQGAAGNAAVHAALDQRATGGPGSAAAEAHPLAAVQRVEDPSGAGADPAVDSEYRLGTAAALEQIINHDVKERLGAEGLRLSIGGGGGVAALRAERPVQDLDLRLHISGAQGRDPEFRRQVVAYLQALLQEQAERTTDGTTVRGTFGGAEVSVTLGEVPTQTRNMDVHDSSAQVPLTVVASLRLFTDKVSAFATRKEKPGEDLAEKRHRDARDLLTLYPQVTAERELTDVLAEHADDHQLIHQGLKNAGTFKQLLDRFKNTHPDTFDEQEWARLKDIARTLVNAAKSQRKPKSEAEPAAQQEGGAAGPSDSTGAGAGEMSGADRKAAKKARRQQKLAER